LRSIFYLSVPFFNLTSFLNQFALMIQKQKKPYYFAGLKLCSLLEFRKPAFGLILLISLLISIYSPSVAQNRVLPSSNNTDKRISGVATDAKGETLPGVSVTIKGTSTGTVTDLAGKYSITVKSNNILSFTYISYVTQEITVENESVINVVLSESSTSLNDVVVIGYGTQKKRDLTGSVSSISEAEIKKVPIASIGQALQGRAAGVQVTQTSQKPGGEVSVRIRGGNSLQGGNEPLYVIDGFPIYNESGPSINPNDIASIEILKDASATSIYGSRGANGVVLITTKKGRAGKAIINFETYYGIQQVSKMLPLLNAKEYAGLFNEAYINDGKPAVYRQSYIDSLGEGTNWQKEIFRSATIQNYQLSFAGGSDKTQYSISANYFNQAGVIINSDYKRASLRINLDTKVTDKFKVGTNIAITRSNENGVLTDVEGGRNGSVVNAALVMNPILPVYNGDGSFVLENDAGTIVGNPVASAKEIKNIYATLRLLANVFGEYAFTKDFTGRISLGTNINNSGRDYYASRNTVLGASQNGVGSISSSRNEQWLNENTLSYNKNFNERNKLNVLLGFTMQGAKNQSFSASSQNFTNDILQENNLGSASQANLPTSGANSWELLSYLGRVTYNFSEKYLLTATARVDGSSRFGEGNKYGFFPSAAFAWRIIEENFLKNSKFLSDLKLRTSYGITGSQEIPQYQSLAALNSTGYVFNNTRVVGYSISRFANPNLKWETTGQFDAGLDIGFL
jgi:TonB-linked SusC/RagA family outer membrane protein